MLTLKELRQPEPMEQVMIRLPSGLRSKAQEIATAESNPKRKVKESDVYRTAIMFFLEQFSTDSREDARKEVKRRNRQSGHSR